MLFFNAQIEKLAAIQQLAVHVLHQVDCQSWAFIAKRQKSFGFGVLELDSCNFKFDLHDVVNQPVQRNDIFDVVNWSLF